MAKNKSESITLIGWSNENTATFVPTANLRLSLPATVHYECTPVNHADYKIFKRVLNMKRTAKVKENGEVTVRFTLSSDECVMSKSLGNNGGVNMSMIVKKEDEELFKKASVLGMKVSGQLTCQIAFACTKEINRSLNPEVSDR